MPHSDPTERPVRARVRRFLGAWDAMSKTAGRFNLIFLLALIVGAAIFGLVKLLGLAD